MQQFLAPNAFDGATYTGFSVFFGFVLRFFSIVIWVTAIVALLVFVAEKRKKFLKTLAKKQTAAPHRA